jgi:hypothetical protein
LGAFRHEPVTSINFWIFWNFGGSRDLKELQRQIKPHSIPISSKQVMDVFLISAQLGAVLSKLATIEEPVALVPMSMQTLQGQLGLP